MKKYFGFAILLTLCLSFALSAQDKPISKEYRDDIMVLMEMMGATDIVSNYADVFRSINENLIKQASPDVPEDVIKACNEEGLKLMKETQASYIESILPIYAKHFSHKEIKKLISFYKTPLGQKILKTSPDLLKECMDAGMKWGQELVPKMRERILERLKKEGYIKNE